MTERSTFGDLPYDINQASSIFEYSKGLLGKTLRDFLKEGYQPKKGKGGLGQMVENIYFLLETNSNPEADFSKAGLELKCTPLKKGQDGNLRIKERLVCNMINYTEIVDEDFEHSHFYLKCQLMLIMFYLHVSGKHQLDLKFLKTVLWKIPAKDLIIIRHDYELIIDKIIRGEAHLISEGDTMYLGACRKGQKGDSLMAQPFSEEGAPRRAFSLKPAYMRTILQYTEEHGGMAVSNVAEWQSETELVSMAQLQEKSFEEIITERLRKYHGKNYLEIVGNLGKKPSRAKHKYSMIANAMITDKLRTIEESEEFSKAGITMKTIRVEVNGSVREAMSFENIHYCDVAMEKEWFESRLYEIFSGRFLFVVYQATGRLIEYQVWSDTKKMYVDVVEKEYILVDEFFWTMPSADLAWAETFWEHVKANVLAGHYEEYHWWKGKKRYDGDPAKKFHVRPKGSNSADLMLTPQNTYAKKYCYWFNNSYVREIIKQRNKTRGNATT